jgi:NADPH:quinone reductase-like Zn-dependent oxidoreductase
MRYMAHDTSIGPSSFEIKECDMPEYYPDKGEVLIKVEATAVNRGDLLQSYGKYPPPRGVTDIIGLECAGYLVDPDT